MSETFKHKKITISDSFIYARFRLRYLNQHCEKRDPYTAGHQFHVSKLAHRIAVEMGLPRDQAEGIRVSGLVHDIGKIAVPIEILSKPGKISEYELNIIRTHPQVEYNILKEIEFPWPVAQIVLEHHERLDGKGYPQGLAGDSILLKPELSV